MSIETKILCDGCGKTRGETNRWWIATLGQGRPTFICKPVHDSTPEELREADLHLCGEDCAVKKFSEFLQKAQ